MGDQSFGKYITTRVLGRGGMATVYEARDPMLDRRVAIKVIHPHLASETGFGERFRREARLVASLRHPHIVQLYDYDVENGQPFMVMESLDGGSLKDRLAGLRAQGETMPLDEIERVLSALASALDYAHVRGAIHRDIKPSNVLFTPTGEPVLTDFGIAKILSDTVQFTLTGGVVGTPAYMAPEQASNGVMDARTDLYSLGVVLYEMATGRIPFEGDSPTAVMLQHLTEPPPPPRQFNSGLPQAVEAVILKALAKDPNERFASAGEMAQAFSVAIRAQSADSFSPEDAATLVEELPTVVDRSERATEERREQESASRQPAYVNPAATPPVPQPAASAPHPPSASIPAPSSTGGRAEAPSSAQTRRRLLTIGVLAVLLVGAAVVFMLWRDQPATTGGGAATLRFRDGTTLTDEAVFSGPNLPPPEAGTQYEIWLVGDGGERPRSIGVLTPGAAGMVLTFTSPDGHNLLAEFDAAQVTLEPSPDSNPLPSEEVVLRGALPPEALVHIRHLLVAREDTPGNIGYAVGLLEQTRELQRRGEALLAAFEAQDTRGLKQIAEGMVNLIEGKEGERYGDLDGNGILADAGDGFGLLLNGGQTGYVQGTVEHARLAAEQPDATPAIRMHAEHVQIAARNVGAWGTTLRDLGLQIISANDLEEVAGPVREAVSLSTRIVEGQDLDGDEAIEPIADEGGAATAFEHAQYMADITLSSP